VDTYGAKDLWRVPVINAICTSCCSISFLSTAFDVVFVLYCYTTIENGGLSLSVCLLKLLRFSGHHTYPHFYQIVEIGYALAVAGFSSTLIQIFITPYILQRFDHYKLYYIFTKTWIWTFLSMPLLHIVAKATSEPGNTSPALWIAIAIVVAFSKISCLTYAYVIYTS